MPEHQAAMVTVMVTTVVMVCTLIKIVELNLYFNPLEHFLYLVAFFDFFRWKNKVDSGHDLPLSITEGGKTGLIQLISHSQNLQRLLQCPFFVTEGLVGP